MTDHKEYDDDGENYEEYEDHPAAPAVQQKKVDTGWNVLKATFGKLQNEDGSKCVTIKARKTAFVSSLIHLDGKNFSFEGREYLEPIYDRNDNEILMKNARQTEKCVLYSTLITMSDGSTKKAGECQSGDKIISLTDNYQPEVDTIIGVTPNGRRKVFKVTTKKKREVVVTANHPFRKLDGWYALSCLKAGDFVALPHTAGIFGLIHEPLYAKILGSMIAEGSFYENDLRFYQEDNEYLKDFIDTCYTLGQSSRKTNADKPGKYYVYLSRKDDIYKRLLKELECKKSADHSIPEEVWGYDRQSAREFIRALWAGDGSCSNRENGSEIALCYASISEKLIQDLQRLLLKFGIFSSYRDNKPTLYKDTDKMAYILRVVDNRSIRRFYHELGPILGKPFTIDNIADKDQSDIIPDDVKLYIHSIVDNDKNFRRHGHNLQSVGLRKTPEYNLTRNKFKKYCDFLDHPWLWGIYKGEVYWDRIESIEEVGEEETYAVQVQNNANHITDGIITHNSTYLSNDLVIKSLVKPFNKSLYVSPSHMQTRQFSSEKLKPILDNSPLIRTYFQDSSVSQQVFEKGFLNGSFIFLRSAFRSADRCLPGSSLITMSDGSIKKLYNLKVGDKVLSFNGRELTIGEVTGKECNGIKPVGRLILLNNLYLDATHNHRFLTKCLTSQTQSLKRLDEIRPYLDSIPVPTAENKDVKWCTVRAVELELYRTTTYDIEVLPDHLFCAGGMFTHNTRGISARNLYIDEIQDFLIDQIPVIRECTSHFPDALNVFAGTPKSLNNPIEIYWKTTSQNEWLVPCKACNKWNFLDERNIAPTELYLNHTLPPGPVCSKCGKPIDITKGGWIPMVKGNNMKGYRVPQLMVPWICGIFSQWLKLLWKRDHYPMSQLYNEVLGLSFDSAVNPITQDEILEICGDYDIWNLDALTPEQINLGRSLLLTAGVDWGEGLDGSEKSPSGKLRPASYTVLTLGYYHRPEQFKVIAIKKFTGKETDSDYVVSYIASVCKTLGVTLVGVDWGHGWGVNNTLVRLLGANRVVQFQHLPKLKQKMKWDPIGFRYHLNRNFMMSELFFDMKNKFTIFPRWKHFEPFSKDIFSIYTEYNEFRREMKYDHRASEPDDFFHSFLYCKLSSDIHLGKTRRYTRMLNESDPL